MFPLSGSYDAWDAFDTIMPIGGGSMYIASGLTMFSATSHVISAAPSSLFDLGLDMHSIDMRPDNSRRPLYAAQPEHASTQSEAASGASHVPLFARRSQPAEPPSPHVALHYAGQQLQNISLQPTRRDHVTAAAPPAAAVPAPAKGPAMLLKLLSSGSGSLGASPLSGLNANPTYTQVPLLQLHAQPHTTRDPPPILNPVTSPPHLHGALFFVLSHARPTA